VDTGPFIIVQHLIVSVCVHEKGQSDQMYDKTKANSALYFNKAAPTETSLHKLEEMKWKMQMPMSVLICRSQLFNHPENPQGNDL
jgi:hypothetical protein